MPIVPLTERHDTVTSCSFGGQTYRSGEPFPATDNCNTCTCTCYDGGIVGCTRQACVACPDGGTGICIDQGELTCARWACFECDLFDDDCEEGWCRATQQGGSACVPFAGAGERCQGYVMPWTRNRCEDALSCVFPEPTQDIPGVCATCSYDGEPYQAGDAFPATDGCNTCVCDASGQVSCTKIYCETCADGSDPVACLADPCEVSSCDVRGATCEADFCGGCHATWSDANGDTVCE